MINNYETVKEFMPGESKGPISNEDHFLYTELMDRTKRVGNNGVRIVKTFYHRSLADFDRHMPQMLALCNVLHVRAYTRLAPRSFRKVGAVFTKLVVDAALSDNFAGMKSLYARACGIVTPSTKLWMFDVDVINEDTQEFGAWLADHGLLLATIPSKKGLHYITPAFDVRAIEFQFQKLALTSSEISLHKDNATNLYIPGEAA
jgi:hypothetical protein